MDYNLIRNTDRELRYYGIYNTCLETTEGDILCSVRRKYFETGEKQKNRSTFNIMGEVYRCTYNMEQGKPLKWKKLAGNKQSERLGIGAEGYFVETLNKDKRVYKRTYYDNDHNLLSVEFYNGNSIMCTVTPSTDGEHPVLVIKKNSVTEVLYPFEQVFDKELTERLNTAAGEPQIFCATSAGNMYFCTYEDCLKRKSALDKLLSSSEEEEADEEIVSDFEINSEKLDEKDIAPEDELLSPSDEPDTAVPVKPFDRMEEPEPVVKFDDISDEDEVLADNIKEEENAEEIKESDELPSDEKDIEVAPFTDDESEFALRKSPCPFTDSCPYEDVDKLVIESAGQRYFYFGDISDDKRSGFGRTAMSDGRTAYEGGYRDDKREGTGVYYFKSGKLCYAGSWKQNKRDGLGVAFSPDDGSAFIGKWSDNSCVGIGASFDKNGRLVYVGKTSDGKRSGAGVTYNAEMDTFFIGKYKDGEFLGTGTQFDSDGNMLYVGGYFNRMRTGIGTSYNYDGSVHYKGEWKNNLFHGDGILYLEDGCILRGSFREGKAYGKCRLTDGIGRVVYIGSFANDMYNGTGRLFSDDGGYVEGRFVDGEPTGIFNEYDRDRNLVYCGEWNDMRRSGKGIEYKNGEKIYDGCFENSVYKGTGKLYENGALVYSGEFVNGIRCGIGSSYKGEELEYFGEWKDNNYNGSGILYDGGIARFVGHFSDGKRTGRVNEMYNGRLFRACIFENDKMTYMCEFAEDGTLRYFGNTVDGNRNGMGCSLNEYSEKEFEGIFKNGVPEKPMQVFYYEPEELAECTALADTEYGLNRRSPEFAVEQSYNGGSYTGQLSDGIPNHKGTILYSDHRFTGEFKNGIASGRGKIYMCDGSEISGYFLDEKKDGARELTFADVSYYYLEQ